MKRFLRLARLFLLVYLIVCLVISLLQRSIIFPGASSQGRKDAIVHPLPDEELVRLTTTDGTPLVAIFGKAQSSSGSTLPDANTRPTILFFYGNGMCMADTAGEFAKLRKLGLNVMVPDYVSYGMSGGKPSEQGVYATAEAAFAYLQSRPDVDATQIIPTGWSLGSAAAIEIAAKHPVPKLITISAFTSMHDMAKRLMPFFPSKLMLQHHFENEQKLRAIDRPILIIHGRRDSIIPFEMSAKLEAAAKGSVKRIAIDEADHNDIFEIGGEEMFNAIAEFASSPAPAPS